MVLLRRGGKFCGMRRRASGDRRASGRPPRAVAAL
jgi:hypothetical protein